jgi:hypothetical protein
MWKTFRSPRKEGERGEEKRKRKKKERGKKGGKVAPSSSPLSTECNRQYQRKYYICMTTMVSVLLQEGLRCRFGGCSHDTAAITMV